MSIRKRLADSASWAAEQSQSIFEPLTQIRIAQQAWPDDDLDMQALTEEAHALMEGDPDRALCAKLALIEFNAGRLSAEQVVHYIRSDISN